MVSVRGRRGSRSPARGTRRRVGSGRPALGRVLGGVLLAPALLFVALNLRPAVIAVSPLVDEIQDDLALSGTAVGMLTTLPVLCFGLVAPLAPRLTRRIGLERTLLVAIAGVVAGIVLRLAPGPLALFGGSVLAGAAIAVGNVLMPTTVRRDFPQHAGIMMGAASMLISAGGSVAAAATVPVEQALGTTWRPALALWAVPAALALLLWAPFALGAGRPGEPSAGAVRVRPLRRSLLAWQVTGLMGLQSLQFYAFTAWAPTIFVDAGRTPREAGLLLALTGVASLLTSAVVPVLATRSWRQHHLIALLIALWAVGYTGLLVDTGALAPLWMVLIGLGQGIGISIALTLISLRSPDAEHTSSLSGMAQGIGYAFAAAGPAALGALHDLSGGWTLPLLAMLVMLVPLGVAGFGAARDRHVAPPS